MIPLTRLLRAATESDRDLLDRYARHRDEQAFGELVRRYGRSVWAACVRLAPRDAEDAFQAVFLTLSRKAGTVTGSLPAWLHSVTRRVASNLRRDARRRASAESGAARLDVLPAPDPTLREGLTLLDEELSRLPERYRAVLIVCCLEGRSRDEAAAQLGWSQGQVKGRLERAREMLRSRLARRGVELGSVFLGAAICGPAPARITPSPVIISLTNGVMRDMAIQKYRLAAAVLAAAVVSVGVLLASGPGQKENPQQPGKAANGPGQAVTTVKANPTVQDLSTALGIAWWEFELPKGTRAVVLGMLEDGRFTQIERCDLQPGLEVPGPLKIAYQEEGSGFKLTVITKGGALRTKGDKPADVMKTYGTAVQNGEYLELAAFKQNTDKTWKYSLVVKVVAE